MTGAEPVTELDARFSAEDASPTPWSRAQSAARGSRGVLDLDRPP